MRLLFSVIVILGMAAAVASCSGNPEDNTPPNIILILVDALRADHLSGYGYSRETSPFLDSLAEKGTRFENAYSHSSHTKVSTASLLTGLIPPVHQVRTGSFSDSRGSVRSDVLSGEVETIAEVLQASDYLTGGFVTNPHLQAFQGFSQGFDEYQYHHWHSLNADGLNDKVLTWLEANHKTPYFLYIHYMDVHFPYNPPAPFDRLYTDKKGLEPLQVNGPPKERIPQEVIDYSMDLYDAQINYWDESFRSLFGRLEEQGLLDNTVIVVVSDHGDEFNEHGGFGHGYTLYTEMLHVPMYFISEGLVPEGKVRDEVVGLIDVAPTVCGLAGIDTGGLAFMGRDLFAEREPAANEGAIIYAETFKGRKPRSVRTEDHQLIYNSQPGTWEFYDIKDDPGMTESVPKGEIPQADELAMMLTEFMEGREVGISQEEVELDEETIEELRSLGYLD